MTDPTGLSVVELPGFYDCDTNGRWRQYTLCGEREYVAVCPPEAYADKTTFWVTGLLA